MQKQKLIYFRDSLRWDISLIYLRINYTRHDKMLQQGILWIVGESAQSMIFDFFLENIQLPLEHIRCITCIIDPSMYAKVTLHFVVIFYCIDVHSV
jgi:hypothetical protein